jgi:ribonuclease III
MLQAPRRKKELQNFARKLGLPDSVSIDWSLLDLALTHPSISKQHNYEQLEFVGDAVVRLATAEMLLEKYSNAPVGDFAAIRSILVSDRYLAEIAESYGLERYLLMDAKIAVDRQGRVSRLADAFEAVLGALYLSSRNMDLVRPWLDSVMSAKATEVFQDPARQNYKDALQEWTQGQYKILPQYRVRENEAMTADTDRFIAEVWLKDNFLAKGMGRTKKAAEQAAAKEAYTIHAIQQSVAKAQQSSIIG